VSNWARLFTGFWARVLTLLVLLGAWQTSADLGYSSKFFFSSPSEILSVVYEWALQGRLLGNVSITLLEALIGFVIGAGVGIGLAFLFKFCPRVAGVFEPFLAIFNSFPRLTLAPLFIVWFGFGIEPKIVLVASFVLFICYLNAYSGLKEVPEELLDRARTWGASRLHLLTTVYAPSAAAWILAGLRTSIGFAFIGAVVGEYIGGDAGIGFLIVTGQSRFRIREVFAGILVLLLVAGALGLCLKYMERHLLRWRPDAN
jgi:NitT/TauT family transport system permease protein